jgi:integrase
MELWQALYLMLACVLGGGIWACPITESGLLRKINVLVTIPEQGNFAKNLQFQTRLVLANSAPVAQIGVYQFSKTPKQHTLGHLECPACEGRKQKAMQVNLSPGSRFSEAARQWKESRQDQLSEGSLRNYGDYLKALNSFFGEMTLDQIHIGHVEEYQDIRKATCGPSRLNHEISTLQQILKRAGLWEEIRKYYEPLRLNDPSVGMALEPDEEAHLFEVAKRKKKWRIAYCCALISNATTAGPKELLHLKLGNIFLDRQPPVILIESGVKNKFRIRTLPLNSDARWAVAELLELAAKKGSYLPGHYLIPGRPKRLDAQHQGERYRTHYDPSRPAGSYRRAWESLRKEAGKKFPRLLTFRRYDLRHNPATKLLEDPRVSDRTIEEMMGHRLNSRTKERYSHIRMQKKLAAVEILESGHTSPEKKRPQATQKLASSTARYFFPIS